MRKNYTASRSGHDRFKSQEFMIEKAHGIFRSKGGIGPKRVLPAKVQRLTQKCFAVEGSCMCPLMEAWCAVVMLDGQALESCVVPRVIKELEVTRYLHASRIILWSGSSTWVTNMLSVLGVFGPALCEFATRAEQACLIRRDYITLSKTQVLLMSSDFTALKHSGGGGQRARISTGPPSFLKEYQSLQVPAIWAWLLRVLVCFCSQLTVSGREMQKKEIHIKRDSHTHANKAEALQRCGAPKNEHIERDKQEKVYMPRHTHTDTQPQIHRHTTHTDRDMEETEFQRDMQDE